MSLEIKPTNLAKTSLNASGQVRATPGYYYGWVVTTALSAAAVTVYDNTSGSGTVVDTIPASAAAGTRGILSTPIPCSTGVYASFGGTGTVLFLHTPV